MNKIKLLFKSLCIDVQMTMRFLQISTLLFANNFIPLKRITTCHYTTEQKKIWGPIRPIFPIIPTDPIILSYTLINFPILHIFCRKVA